MQTVVIDGKEYVLVPKEQLQPVETPVNNGTETTQDEPGSPLDDFLDTSPVSTPQKPFDDGLATNAEKQNSIRVVVPQENPQDTTVSVLPDVPKATPRPYAYRERFIKQELMPADITAQPTFHRELLAGNPEDPMIKADQNKPRELQLFYGPGTQQE